MKLFALSLLVLVVGAASVKDDLALRALLDGKRYDSRYSGRRATRVINADEARACHDGVRGPTDGRLCGAYATPINTSAYPSLPASCWTNWSSVAAAHENPLNGTFGNCVAHAVRDGYRFVHSNSIPPYYFNPYCPFGIGEGYCIEGEPCPFPELVCGTSPGRGFTAGGDVWVAAEAFFKLPARGDPTRADAPRSMYATVDEGEKSVPPSVGVHLNGVNIQGPNDAGRVNVDEAHFQLTCGGHVTPPVGGAKSAPLYHYHKAADCTAAFKQAAIPIAHGGTPGRHAALFGYANDGFGIYAFEDLGGAKPVLDECGGHFGPVDDADPAGSVAYHYHATTACPYHLACQGPALGRCAATQHGASWCGAGCGGYEVCVQPGTARGALEEYAAGFGNATWLASYTTNDYTR